MLIPIVDSNGYGDIESVELDLASNVNEDITIIWNSQAGCTSSHESLIISNCSILGDTDHFDSHFTLYTSFYLDWNFNPDSSIEREVQITATDDSGQSSRSDLDSSGDIQAKFMLI